LPVRTFIAFKDQSGDKKYNKPSSNTGFAPIFSFQRLLLLEAFELNFHKSSRLSTLFFFY
tara:strand:+ start:154 stop:333 length:180 start_codon:yes stop_codon:yes gene_type:complete